MPAKQVVVVKTTTTRTRTKANNSKSLSSSGKKVSVTGKRSRGDPNRCSQCGRYL